MQIDELADLLDVSREDLLSSIVKQARRQEGFNFDPDLPDEVLERMIASLEITEAPKNRNGSTGPPRSGRPPEKNDGKPHGADDDTVRKLIPDPLAFGLGLIVDTLESEDSGARDPAAFRELGNRFLRDVLVELRRRILAFLRLLTGLLENLSLSRTFVLMPGF